MNIKQRKISVCTRSKNTKINVKSILWSSRFFVFEATKQAVVKCLSVLPTNPTHTLGRLNTGGNQNVNFTRELNPAPTNIKTRKTNKQETNRQKD